MGVGGRGPVAFGLPLHCLGQQDWGEALHWAPKDAPAAPGSAEGQDQIWLLSRRGTLASPPVLSWQAGCLGCRRTVPKEAPPDRLRISLYYLNPLCTTTKNKKMLLNSLQYENYKLCTLTAVSARVKDHGLWWLDLRPRMPQRHVCTWPAPPALALPGAPLASPPGWVTGAMS